MASRIILAALCTAVTAGAAAAQSADSAAFVIRLGTDTLAVERYVRAAQRIEVEAVHRSPTTMRHRFVYTLAPDGRVTGGEWTAQPPGAAQPAFRREFRFVGDSAVVTTVQEGSTAARTVAAANAIPLGGPFYTPYELVLMQAAKAGARSEVPLLAGTNLVRIPVERVATDSMALENQFGEPMRVRTDARGRLLALHTPAFTTVQRTGWVDLDALTAEFARRDETGRGMGALSPRQTTRVRLGEANLWLDYSRPAMRGRPVWGGLVPWGQVWRTGANDAAHFATDRTVQLGELVLEPGTYTLFVRPAQDGWSLIVNRGTGMSGLARDPAQDVGSTPLTVQPLERPVEQFTMHVQGSGDDAALAISWDRTRAVVPIRVR